jgi:hypothetical protein
MSFFLCLAATCLYVYQRCLYLPTVCRISLTLRDLILKKGTKTNRASQQNARKFLIKNKEVLQDDYFSVYIDK